MFGILKMLKWAHDDLADVFPSNRVSRGGVCYQVQVCKKCKATFGERRGPEYLMMSLDATEDEKTCPHCGGSVVWR